jgi:hypothetical protein
LLVPGGDEVDLGLAEQPVEAVHDLVTGEAEDVADAFDGELGGERLTAGSDLRGRSLVGHGPKVYSMKNDRRSGS